MLHVVMAEMLMRAGSGVLGIFRHNSYGSHGANKTSGSPPQAREFRNIVLHVLVFYPHSNAN